MRGATGSLAVTVTTLFGQRELVTRPLPPEVAENSALSGAAVMSDGQIALIVDCDALETAVARPSSPPKTKDFVSTQYTELQLDALRELANIGSGTASAPRSRRCSGGPSTSPSPTRRRCPFAEAVDAAGAAEQEITGIVLGIVGEMSGTVLLLVPPADADAMCRMLGVEPDDEFAALRPRRDRQHRRHLVHQRARLDDRHGASSRPRRRPRPTCSARSSRACWPSAAPRGDVALMLDSNLVVEGEDCSVSFLLVPDQGGVDELLSRLGLS